MSYSKISKKFKKNFTVEPKIPNLSTTNSSTQKVPISSATNAEKLTNKTHNKT